MKKISINIFIIFTINLFIIIFTVNKMCKTNTSNKKTKKSKWVKSELAIFKRMNICPNCPIKTTFGLGNQNLDELIRRLYIKHTRITRFLEEGNKILEQENTRNKIFD